MSTPALPAYGEAVAEAGRVLAHALAEMAAEAAAEVSPEAVERYRLLQERARERGRQAA